MLNPNDRGDGLDTGRNVRINPDVVANRVGDQIVIVHIKTDRIFSLNPTASRFWELLSSGMSRGEIQTSLLQEFKVPAEQLDVEIENILTSLRSEGIILVDD